MGNRTTSLVNHGNILPMLKKKKHIAQQETFMISSTSSSPQTGTSRQQASGTRCMAQLTDAHCWSLTESAIPDPMPGTVRVRLHGCGLCASNLPPFDGRPWFDYPFAAGVPGHESWGTIDSIGEDVHTVVPGDRVCCLDQSAFSTHVVCDQNDVVRLPAEFIDREVPGEPLACAMNIFERARIEAGQYVAVVGCGFIGCLLIQLIAAAGAIPVGVSRRASSLAMAERSGAQHLLFLEDSDALPQVLDGQDCERVIEVTGTQAGLDHASKLVGTGGMLIIAGFHQDGLRQVDMQSWNWRGIDVINAHERDPARYRCGLHAAIAALRDGRLFPEPLYTHRFPLNRIQEAFETALAAPEGFTKALIVMT
ncbi:MAG: MDR/zinc-dependent alcohol dehydrogenase-like family protein [Planctomycetota bacterium]